MSILATLVSRAPPSAVLGLSIAAALSAPAADGPSRVLDLLARMRQARQERSVARAGASAETFVIGAQYRGVVKKSFPDLGRGTIRCRALEANRYEVGLEAKARHPRKKETIEFSVLREFALEGHHVKILSEKNWFNEGAARHQKKLQNAVCLAYLVKWRSPQAEGERAPAQTYVIDDVAYTFSYRSAAGRLEVSLADPDGKVAKFFLGPSVRAVRPIDRFRVFTRDDVVISFVVQ